MIFNAINSLIGYFAVICLEADIFFTIAKVYDTRPYIHVKRMVNMAVIPLLPKEGIALALANMRIARAHGMSRNMAIPTTYLWFYQKVRNKGPWDYKQGHPELANFGNFNYGSAGYAAGIPSETLLMGAGWAQERAKTSKKKWGHWYQKPPYGDDPHDQFWISQGIEYAKKYAY
ncbi:polymorphic toxin type 44 domain-containing protein [Enterobacter asburiae]|uniref:polymorphic toxin type 44 domain-containing protein n=1 Tax=Enterobacter asburiae TaxID=61645 RepID=UPI001F380A7F|nr:polymorphic toxin type 44 domain-containing protein [Enterobacter asburiae]